MRIVFEFVEQIKEKPMWVVALFLSLVYLILFLLVSKGTIDSGLLFGFCVWGSPGIPDKFDGCADAHTNSHQLSFIVDVVMTVVTAIFWYLDPNKRAGGDFKHANLMYLAQGFLILSHGMLHWFLQQTSVDFFPIIDCYNEDIGDGADLLGKILFGIFTFALGLTILGVGFGFNKWSTYLGSAVFTAAVLAIIAATNNNNDDDDDDDDDATTGGMSGGELFLPGLFCVVHPLSCVTALYSNAPIFRNGRIGALFAICTTVGILELSACRNVLRPMGGHVWYDVTLHMTVVASTPYFFNSSTSATTSAIATATMTSPQANESQNLGQERAFDEDVGMD